MKLYGGRIGCCGIGLVFLALVTGCAAPGGASQRAPIEERGPSAARVQRPTPALPPKPQPAPALATRPSSSPATAAAVPPPSRGTSRPAPAAQPKPPVPPLPTAAVAEPASHPDAGLRTIPEPAVTPRGVVVRQPSSSTQSPAVQALVEVARQQADRGDMEAAAASLERALVIEPQNPHLWNRLALVRLAQGALGPAAELAAKSNLYAGAEPALQVRNWRLIAQVRERQGDTRAASDAYRRAELAQEALQ